MRCETKLECVRELEYLDFLTFDAQIAPDTTRAYWQSAVDYSKSHKSRVNDCKVTSVTDLLDAQARTFILAKALEDDTILQYNNLVLRPAQYYVENSGTSNYQQEYNMTIAEALNKSIDSNTTTNTNVSIISKALNRALPWYCAEPIKFA
jgi:hypothetical protein